MISGSLHLLCPESRDGDSAGLLILARPSVPPRENPIANLFKVPVNRMVFFVEAHVKLRPIDFSTDGVFLCGLAHSPKAMDESIAQGLGLRRAL